MATHPIALDLGPVIGPPVQQGPAIDAETLNAAVNAAVDTALTPTEDSVSQKIQPSQNVSLTGTIYRFGSLCILNLLLSKQNESGEWGTETSGAPTERLVATISDSNLFPVHSLRGALGHTSEGGSNTPAAYFVISADGTISINNQANIVMISVIYPVAVAAN